MQRHEELIKILETEDLSQAQLARFLGCANVTVNRWVRQRDTDAQDVPEYALSFARAYAMLNPMQRRRLHRQVNGTAA